MFVGVFFFMLLCILFYTVYNGIYYYILHTCICNNPTRLTHAILVKNKKIPPDDKNLYIYIYRERERSLHIIIMAEINNNNNKIMVPQIDSVVIGKVLRISRMYVSVEILILDDSPVPYPFTGTIRKLDVRQNAVDDIKIEMCYRPGDIVKAEVISLGDRRNYLLSTAKPELGVLNGNSENGNDMKAISYSEMEDTITGEKETRKVAMIDVNN